MEAGVGPNVDCSSKRAAAAGVTPLLPLPTCTCNVFDVGEPVPGLITCNGIVPAVAALPEALRLVGETNVVGSMTPPKMTWAPLRKSLPLTAIVKSPTGRGAGRAAETTGRLLNRVTNEGALLDCGSSTLGAPMVMVDPVMPAGAVYNPVVEMVPTVALPPGAPFTFQMTLGLVVPVIVALNCTVSPGCS